MRRWVSFLSLAMVLACATPVFAHPQQVPHSHGTEIAVSGFEAGFAHPFGGLDHLLAMVAVGGLAVMTAGASHRRWVLPGSFVGGMLLGGVAGLMRLWMPGVEILVALSVLVLGSLLIGGGKLRIECLPAAIAMFGAAHGYAHGTEMPAIAAPWLHAAGVVTATVMLHGLGMAAGIGAARRPVLRLPLRLSGAAIAMAGLWMVWQVI